jgi:hypothetical protein
VITILGLGGMGKSSLAIALAHQVLSQFEVVLFRSLQNGPPLAELLDQTIRAVSDQHSTPPEQLGDKLALLVQLLRARRCLLILDNFEAILQPDALSGTYRSGYADYGALLHALIEREHHSCLLLTSREKPSELGPLQGRTAPVRTLPLAGLDDNACSLILAAKDIAGTADDIAALVRLYGGNPLALNLVAEPIQELFGGDVGAFLATGEAFVGGVGILLAQQLTRSTPLEHAIVYWLAVERELVPLAALLADLGEVVPQREVLAALESLLRRMLIQPGWDRATFTLQPVVREYLTDELIRAICQELLDGQPWLLHRHALVQATAKEYVRRSQEQMIATPLLERLAVAAGGADALERQLLTVLASWRDQPLGEVGYGPGTVINLLRLLRGHLRGLDLARLAIRQAYLQGLDLQDTSLAHAVIHDSVFSEPFDDILAVTISSTGAYWAASSRRGEIWVWEAGGLTLRYAWRAHTDMVWTLTFSPDGRTLASASWDGTVKLWDTSTLRLGSGQAARFPSSTGGSAGVASGHLQQTLTGHTDRVRRVAWSPDGRILASCGFETTIWLWDNERSSYRAALQGHIAAVTGLAFTPTAAACSAAARMAPCACGMSPRISVCV